jgi:V/A-type H+-transporting ATPase subunit I
VVGFAGVGERPLMRVFRGFAALTGLSGAFGDVLSYMRLFALGLASASLAVAFNGMAGDVKEALPGVGFFFAIVVLLIGHTLNFVLSLSSGFIHGLRLNVIEFFKWGVKDEGTAYRPFERKESMPWTTSS